MVGERSGFNTVAPWWSVFHHSTEKWTMGTSTEANRQTKALRLARTSGSAGTRRRARYPRNSTSSTAVLVRRASQAQ